MGYGDHVVYVAMVTGGETGWPNPKGNGATDGIVQPVWWLVEEYLIIYCKYTVISWLLSCKLPFLLVQVEVIVTWNIMS